MLARNDSELAICHKDLVLVAHVGWYRYLFKMAPEYCARGELIEVNNVVHRTVEVCGVSTATANRCRREQDKPETDLRRAQEHRDRPATRADKFTIGYI